MPNVRVTIDQIEVHKDGDPSGKGELYYLFRANGITISERSVNSPRETSSGENIVIDANATVTLSDSDTLRVYLSVSDEDKWADGADESASVNLNYTAANGWGDGPFQKRLTSGPLDVTVHGQIDLL